MAKSRKLRVMISSRCDDRFPAKGGRRLSDIRREVKRELESSRLLGAELFEVWINEATPPQGGTWDSWDTCIEAVKECDIFLSLYNGNAGWAPDEQDIGICHAELQTALLAAPAKVRLIDLGSITAGSSKAGQRNGRFQDYVKQQNLFRGGTVKTVDQLKERAREAIFDAVLTFSQSGVREASRGRFDRGEALDWQRLDLEAREARIREVLASALSEREGGRPVPSQENEILLDINGTSLLLVVHGMPAAASVAQAREMVGQPYLSDHRRVPRLQKGVAGPVHIVGCHRTLTEAQAIRTLGFADATFVTTSFGLYVADGAQKIQMVFIGNCRDETTTRYGVQRFIEWLQQTGEIEWFVKRAISRANIVRAITKEVEV
jgi:Domain of unknown function (DUF4062)